MHILFIHSEFSSVHLLQVGRKVCAMSVFVPKLGLAALLL